MGMCIFQVHSESTYWVDGGSDPGFLTPSPDNATLLFMKSFQTFRLIGFSGQPPSTSGETEALGDRVTCSSPTS